MAGQSITDRIVAARHSLAGQGLAKTVCKATTEEVMGPKKKHLDYLLQCTNEPNVSIPQMADLLIQRTQHANWVVVFKSLISIHNVMNYGNERFTQYLASNNCSFNLGNFLDKAGVQGYDMSTFVRRYSKYLNEKASSYRHMAFDFCKVKRGKEDGLLRTMNTEKLLKALPVLQRQVDALLEFDCTPNELSNGVVNACFMLMFKDLIRLFACYNDGIINLLEKYFDMNKKHAREALEIYKRFLVRMERVSEFLKVAENVGIDKGDIPDLAKAPSSLLEALEAHLASLEANKKGGTTPTSTKPASLTTAINSLASVSSSAAANISEDEKRQIIDDERRQMEALKVDKKYQEDTNGTNPFAPAAPSSGIDLLGSGSPATSPSGGTNDLFSLSAAPAPVTNPFASSMDPQAVPVDLFAGAAPASSTVPSAWNAPAAQTQATTPTAMKNGNSFDAKFDEVFGHSSNSTVQSSVYGLGVMQPSAMVNNTTHPPPGFDGFGEVMAPAGGKQVPTQATKPEKFIKGDLDTSMALLAGNLNIGRDGNQMKKQDLQWNPSAGTKKMTGGTNFQNPGSMQMGYPQQQPMMGQMPMGGMGMQPMANPAMMGGYQQPMGMQPQMGMQMGMTQQGMPQQGMAYGAQPHPQMSYGQPRPQTKTPNDPFGAL